MTKLYMSIEDDKTIGKIIINWKKHNSQILNTKLKRAT